MKSVFRLAAFLVFLNLWGPLLAADNALNDHGADRARLRSRITHFPQEFGEGGFDIRRAEALAGRRLTVVEIQHFDSLHQRATLVRERAMSKAGSVYSAPGYFRN